MSNGWLEAFIKHSTGIGVFTTVHVAQQSPYDAAEPGGLPVTLSTGVKLKNPRLMDLFQDLWVREVLANYGPDPCSCRNAHTPLMEVSIFEQTGPNPSLIIDALSP
jgi:hypothetical protein